MFLRDLEFERNDWFYVGIADLTALRDAHARAGRSAAGRERALRVRLAAGRPPRLLRERQVQRGLAHQRERRHARRPGRRAVQQLPQQGARLAVPAHRSGLSLPDVRRRLGRGRGRADARQDVREAGARRKSRDVGQLQDQLRRQRAGARRPRAVRRQPALSDRGRHELRRAALHDRRLRRRARHAGQPRGIPRHRRLALLPAQPGHPGRLRAPARRAARQGFGPGQRRGQPAAGARLRHRLPAGPRRARRAAELDRRRPAARAQRRAQRRCGVPGGPLRIHARLHGARFDRDRRPGARVGQRLREGRPHDERQRGGRHREQSRRRRRHAAHERGFVAQGAGRPQRRPGFERDVFGRRRLRLRQSRYGGLHLRERRRLSRRPERRLR